MFFCSNIYISICLDEHLTSLGKPARLQIDLPKCMSFHLCLPKNRYCANFQPMDSCLTVTKSAYNPFCWISSLWVPRWNI